MRHTLVVISRCFALLLLGTGLANAQVDRAIAERVLQKSGTLAQVDAVPAQFKGNFEQGLREQRDTPFTRDEINRFLALAERTFTSKALGATIIATVADQLNTDHGAILEAWYDGATGKRILAVEAAAAKADPAVTVREGSALFGKLSESRRELLKELLAASRAADFVADLSIDMAVTAAHATAAVTSAGSAIANTRTAQPSLKELRESAAKDRSQVVTSMNELLLVVYAKTYESLSDDELRVYVTALTSAAGKQFTEAVIVAFNRALFASASELGKAISELNKPAKK